MSDSQNLNLVRRSLSFSLSNAWVSWAQWIAMVAMTVEHVVRFVLPSSDYEQGLAILLGRLAFPLFAGMIAWHLVFNTRDPFRYLSRLLILAVISQLPYALVIGSQANVLFVLAAGVSLVVAWFFSVTLSALLFGCLVLVSPFLEYGLPGVLLVPAFVVMLRTSGRWFSEIPLLSVVYFINDGALFTAVALVAALVVVFARWGLFDDLPACRSMPRRLSLSWYPLHLSVIFILNMV